MKNHRRISIAIETSCRQGGLALGIGDTIHEQLLFDASSRHAAQLIDQLAGLLNAADLSPQDVDELYVSAGPGSFTGTRIGVTVARTFAQQCPSLQCLAVHSPDAVAQGCIDLPWEHLAVILDAKEKLVYASLYTRTPDRAAPAGPPPRVQPLEEFLNHAPRPLAVAGEGLHYHPVESHDVTPLPEDRYLPTPAAVWQVGKIMAAGREFMDYHRLLPIYSRKPEAVRLWEKRQAAEGKPDRP